MQKPDNLNGIKKNKSYLFVDGRYTLQAKKEIYKVKKKQKNMQ